MPYNVDLYNSSIILKLAADPYGIHVSGSNIGAPVAAREFSPTASTRFARLMSTERENRMIEMPLQMTGASMDDWIINSQQIHAVLRDAELYNDPEHFGEQGDRAFFALQMPNATSTTVWEVICGDLEEGNLFQSVMAKTTPLYPMATLRLYCHKWGHPQQITRVTSGTLNNGDDFYILASPQGEREAPCKITVQPAAGDDFRRVILSKRSRGNVGNFVWLFECETGTFTGYTVTNIETSARFSLSNVADAGSHGGSLLRIAHTATGADVLADVIGVTITDNLEDFRGRHKVFLISAAGSGPTNWTAARQSYGGPTGNAIPGSTVTMPSSFGVDDGLYLGEIEIPYPWTPLGAGNNPAFAFILEASFANAAFNSDWDCVLLIPCDEQYAEIELTDANSATQDMMVWDNLSLVPWTYVLDVNGDVQSDRLTYGQNARFTVTPGVDNAFFCVFSEDAGEGAMKLREVNLTDNFVLTIDYLPQYELLIGA